MSLRTGAVSLLRTSRLVTSHQAQAGLARSALVFSDIQVSFVSSQIVDDNKQRNSFKVTVIYS